MCNNEEALLFEVCLVNTLYGIVRDFVFITDGKPVFIGDEFFVFNNEQINGEEYSSGGKKRRDMTQRQMRELKKAASNRAALVLTN